MMRIEIIRIGRIFKSLEKLKKIGELFFLIGSFLVSTVSVATLPVIDWASLANEGTEISHLVQQIDLLENQWDTEKAALTSMTGATGFGEWGNSEIDLQKHQWSPSSWVSALSLDASSNSGRFNELLAEYEASHPGLKTESTDSYPKGASEALSSMFREQLTQDKASQAIASGAYADVNSDFKILQELGAQIGDKDSDPDLKHAVDLNSRVQLEIGNLSVQQLRMLALLNQQLAQTQATALEQQEDAAAYSARDFAS